MAGRLLGTMVFSLGSVAVSYSVGAWLFNYEIAVEDPLAFAVSCLLAFVALWSSALAMSALGVLSRSIHSFLNIFEYPVYILAGFLVPIALLPGWTNIGSYLLPPFWAALALHSSAGGHVPRGDLLPVWAMLILSTLATLLIARPLYGLVLARARASGTLALS